MSVRGKKIGLVLPHWEGYGNVGCAPRAIEHLRMVQRAEDRGFDSIWLVDHLVSEPAVDEADFGYEMPDELEGVKLGYWECWTMAAALAAATRRIEIGTLVSNTGYRNPGLLAQMVNTVDDLSDGRVVLGLGAGDYVGEHHTYGYPYERRVSRFEEALKIILPLLRGENVSLEGEFYQVRDAEIRPPGPRAGGPPILIGLLRGGPRMQRLVAQHADYWDCWMAETMRVEFYREARDAIVQACEKHGRDPETLRKHAAIGIVLPGFDPINVIGEPLMGRHSEIVDALGPFLEEDIDHFSVTLEPWTGESVDQLGKILDELR
jgi:alkanesulfonate monooxygenase SsuD/methylene tetrahydromethanopterin reductase-like flavin-dependent oxidoreductase (luciferase family)